MAVTPGEPKALQLEDFLKNLQVFFVRHSKSVLLEAQLLAQLEKMELPPNVQNTVHQVSDAFTRRAQAQNELANAMGLKPLDLVFLKEGSDA